jgi:hypothetical protein
MASFRIHRMRHSARQSFRWAPHVSGVAQLKPRDYEQDGEVEALNYYDAWAILRGSPRALEVGDALETLAGELRVCKYVGFEEARWVLPEPKPEALAAPAFESAAPDCPA